MHYVSCRFHRGDPKGYTYAYDGEVDLRPGDKVEVEKSKRYGGGVCIVEVIGYVEKPDFACKPILRVLPRERADG
jgi:hypothetical protein